MFDINGKGKSGKGDDHKGKGRGYQGVCWNCGKVGHKANECAFAEARVRGRGGIVEEADVGGVWMVGNVEVETVNMKLKQVEVPPGLDLVWSQVGRRGKKKMSWPIDAEAEIKQDYHNESYWSFAANRFEVFKDDLEEDIEEAETGDSQWRMFRKIEVPAGAVKAADYKPKLSRESKMRFNVAKVQKPLASAAKVVEAGNKISVGPNPEDNSIGNITTGERIGLRVEKGTFVFDVEFMDGEAGTITLDSGAGVNVWPMDVQ